MSQRSQQVLEALHVDPGGSVNAAFDKWSDTLAAYRLFDNNAVTSEALLKPHYAATLARINEHAVVLVLQDTTELDFTKWVRFARLSPSLIGLVSMTIHIWR